MTSCVQRNSDGGVVFRTAQPVAIFTRNFEEALQIDWLRRALTGDLCGITNIA
jgi:hypothetical protein